MAIDMDLQVDIRQRRNLSKNIARHQGKIDSRDEDLTNNKLIIVYLNRKGPTKKKMNAGSGSHPVTQQNSLLRKLKLYHHILYLIVSKKRVAD